MKRGIPEDIRAINETIRAFLDTKDRTTGIPIRRALGVYAFYDYDNEPIYVGQTEEGLGSRIGRHMTNQRTDAVAMNVLDPFEVASIEVWPLRYGRPLKEDSLAFQAELNAAEYTVFDYVLQRSTLGAILNEKDIATAPLISLPDSYKATIVPNAVYVARSHPDIRIARRANTIAQLAQVISERDVSSGLRRTLVTQARRLQILTQSRFIELGGRVPVELPGEETGEELAP